MERGQVEQQGEHNLGVRYLKKVGPVTGSRLEKNGIRTLVDLLCYLPCRYVDPAWLTPLNRIDLGSTDSDTPIHVVGKVHHASECFSTELGSSWFEVHVGDNPKVIAKWSNYSLKELEAYVRIGHWGYCFGALPARDHSKWRHLSTRTAKSLADREARLHFSIPFWKDSRMTTCVICWRVWWPVTATASIFAWIATILSAKSCCCRRQHLRCFTSTGHANRLNTLIKGKRRRIEQCVTYVSTLPTPTDNALRK